MNIQAHLCIGWHEAEYIFQYIEFCMLFQSKLIHIKDLNLHLNGQVEVKVDGVKGGSIYYMGFWL